MNDEEKEKIINFGAFGYKDITQMSNILNWDESKTKQIMSTKDWTDMYTKGLDRCNYAIDLKLFEMVLSGDLKALDQFEHRKKTRK